MALTIVEDDLNGAEVQALLAYHLRGMHAASPPGSVFALDLSGLRASVVTVFAARDDGRLAGIGALKDLGDGNGEIKSMRTHPDHLRKGIAAALLDHIIAEARRLGLGRLSLETGKRARLRSRSGPLSQAGLRRRKGVLRLPA